MCCRLKTYFLPVPADTPLRTTELFALAQAHLDAHPNTAVIAETGDSWFNSQKLRLPEGTEYEMQMRYDWENMQQRSDGCLVQWRHPFIRRMMLVFKSMLQQLNV